MFPEVGEQGNIDRKHVSATMFPSLPRALGETHVLLPAVKIIIIMHLLLPSAFILKGKYQHLKQTGFVLGNKHLPCL